MDHDEFVTVMNESQRLIDNDDPATALDRLTAFDDALTEQPDPAEYGWIFFYRFRAAFLSADYKQALHLAEHGPQRFTADVHPQNAAWMHSAAAEAAAELNLPEKVVTLAQACISLRRDQDNQAEILMAATTACTLLDRLNRCDLNSPFATILITENQGAEAIKAQGYLELTKNIKATANSTLLTQLKAARKWLKKSSAPQSKQVLEFLNSPTP